MFTLSRETRSGSPTGPVVPAAERAQRPGWRDPRILLGLVLVAGCVLIGARVMASADDTVAVWSAQVDLPAGTVLDREDLRLTRLRFADAKGANAYFGSDDLPDGRAALTRAVGAGELVARSAVGAEGRPLIEVPLAVGRADLPATVRSGAVVDVWFAGESKAGGKSGARRILDDVVVVALPSASDSLAPESTRQVIVGVPEESDELAAVLGVGDGRLVITQRSGTAVQP